MMNKKMIMLISMMFSGSFVVGSEAQVTLAPLALTAEQNEVYQGLVAKFQASQLTAEDNTVENIGILTQEEAFLSQAVKVQATKKQSLWPYWLAASVRPAATMITMIGNAFKGLHHYLNGDRAYYTHSVFRNIGDLVHKPLYWPTYINKSLGLPKGTLSTLLYIVAPAVAFYGIYKMYSSLKNQQQELEMVRDILAALKTFGQPN